MVAEHVDGNTMVLKGVKLLVPNNYPHAEGTTNNPSEDIGDANFEYTILRIKDSRTQMIADSDTGRLIEDKQYLIEWDPNQVLEYQPNEEWVSQRKLSVADDAVKEYERNKHRLSPTTGGAGTTSTIKI